MKCSDCKLFRTDGCRNNPAGKDLDFADSFACFEPGGTGARPPRDAGPAPAKKAKAEPPAKAEKAPEPPKQARPEPPPPDAKKPEPTADVEKEQRQVEAPAPAPPVPDDKIIESVIEAKPEPPAEVAKEPEPPKQARPEPPPPVSKKIEPADEASPEPASALAQVAAKLRRERRPAAVPATGPRAPWGWAGLNWKKLGRPLLILPTIAVMCLAFAFWLALPALLSGPAIALVPISLLVNPIAAWLLWQWQGKHHEAWNESHANVRPSSRLLPALALGAVWVVVIVVVALYNFI